MSSSSNDKWEKYYENYNKKSVLISIIEFANRNWFTPRFMDVFYEISGKKKGLKIIEPGCGSGLMSSLLAKQNDVTVLDLSQNALDTAKINFTKIGVKGKFVKGDLFKMPFKKNTFDVVWNQGVLEHFKDPSDAIIEMMRITKKGGYVVIYLPAFLSPLHFVWMLLGLLGLRHLWPFDRQDFYSQKEFAKFMVKANCSNWQAQRLWLRSLNMSQVFYCKKK